MQGASQQRRLTSEVTAASLPFHPDFDGQVQLLEIERPRPDDDERNTAQTIDVMAELVRQDCQHPTVRRAAWSAIAAVAGDTGKEAEAIHRWIRDHVRFVTDSSLAGFSDNPDEAEVLIRPIDLLAMPGPKGDCDDFSMLAAAMLRAVGIPCAFKTVAAERGNPNYSHVYVLAFLPSGQLPIDASHGPYPGWEAKATGKSRVWPIEENMTRPISWQPLGALADGEEDSGGDSGGSGFDWGGFATGLTNTAGKILGARYGVAQLSPGQMIRGADGSLMYQAAPGQSMPNSLSSMFGTGGGSSNMLMLGAAALVLVMVLSRK